MCSKLAQHAVKPLFDLQQLAHGRQSKAPVRCCALSECFVRLSPLQSSNQHNLIATRTVSKKSYVR
jgi:hypothetical protein